MSVRVVPLVVGVLAFLLAVFVLFGSVSVPAGQGLLGVVALVVLLIAAVAMSNRRQRTRNAFDAPDPERRQHVPVPGASLTGAAGLFHSQESPFSAGDRVSSGLYEAATAALTRFDGCSLEEARERLREGTWSDDPYANAFFAPEVDPPTRTLRDRLTRGFVRHTSYREGVRHTARAVATITSPHADEPPLAAYDPEELDEPETRTTADAITEPVVERSERSTGHWVGIGVVSLLAVGLGALLESPAIVVAGAVAIGYAAVANATDPPTPDLSIERQFDRETPEPGDEVTVTVTFENESGRILPDVRIVDGVPTGLPVTDGVARIATALRPGESLTFEYTVTALNGRHTFDPTLVVTRDFARSSEREFLVAATDAIVCEPVLRPVTSNVPLRTTASTFAGHLTTAEAGSGTQFHSVREYRKSDPLNRIDWNRHARTGELATLEFHEERAARVVVLVDARKAAYLAPTPDTTHAVDRSVGAAGRIAATLLENGDAVGLAALGPYYNRTDDPSPEACWLAPGSGGHHRARYQRTLAAHPQFSSRQPESEGLWSPQVRALDARLSAETQVVFLTALCDRTSKHIAEWLDAHGHTVTVVSPDPTTTRTVGHQLVRTARRIYQFDLQRGGIPVVDWPHEESIDDVFARNALAARSGGGR
ncbi:DUF58 domain-containing protein [Natronobiforma cellulositropha]|uniref:DUF58 domain-containing protein n=1 Tax=Natronobiforma cellulositropha TaxID=1679076 RepID=UPI0021D59377|nr:DUF58 domain-containing protein [Natronobiforma cellulositropha]